ncbi:hypothetical protein [Acidisoma cladoniae]|uniref:hypothetical protein n=1 Tax=Acidisoma cladoniae TaxID=3040935 RepID=UPI00254DFA09|nr:hypothetical protein [Acidisoma sp. PAMC 29798]
MSESDRVTRLETHFEYVKVDLTDLKVGQKDLADKMNAILFTLQELPTKNDLWSWKIQWLAIGLGAMALIVGGIIGGLDWIKPR